MGSRSMPHPNGVTMFEGCELEDTSFEVCLKTSSSWDTFGKDWTKLDPNKVKVVLEFPIPRIVANVRTFLGLTLYYVQKLHKRLCTNGSTHVWIDQEICYFSMESKLSKGVWTIETGSCICSHIGATKFQQGFHSGCKLVYQGGWGHSIPKVWEKGMCDHIS